MTTTNAKDFKHLAKARISSEKIEGILYLDKDGYWYIFHNGDFHDGAKPAEFERVRGIYKKSWYLCLKDSISELEIELVDDKKEARKAARKKTIVDSDDYGYLEDSEEPEKISDVSRFISGAAPGDYSIGTKVYVDSHSSSDGYVSKDSIKHEGSRCTLPQTSDWQIAGDSVPRRRATDMLLILGL